MNLSTECIEPTEEYIPENPRVSGRQAYGGLWSIIRCYAGPYAGSYVLLVLLNLLVFIFTAATTFATAAVISVLTGTLEQSTPAEPLEKSWLNLNHMGAKFIEYMGLDQGQSMFHSVILLAGTGFLFGLARSVTRMGSQVFGAYTSQKASHALQRGLFRHYLDFSMTFFNKNRAGQLISRMEIDTTSTLSGVQAILFNMIVNPLLIGFFAVITWNASPVLFGSVILAGLLHWFLTMLMGKPMQENMKQHLKVSADYRALVMEAFSGIRVVKSFGAEKHEEDRVAGGLRALLKTNVKRIALSNYQTEGRLVINALVQVLILAFCAWELSRGNMNIASTLLFVYLCQAVVAPISQMGSAFVTLQSMKAASERINQYFQIKPRIQDGSLTVDKFKKELRLQSVSFAYGPDRPVLNDVSFTVERGSMVALVGHSGAGKSTLADLILRFYDPTRGCITLDGIELREFNQKSYRSLFGIVSQDSLLFHDTIAENISYGRKGISRQQIEKAARIANAHDFISAMPDGYETLVGDRGVRLSGGQRQRVAIARAVVANPQILILDEATSALDSESEKLVKEAIDHITQDTTSIVIAHRLSTVIHADLIVVMHEGKLLDAGTHSQLLTRCELYKKLCELQFTETQKQTL
ncbi:MAG: ABC transporter ATP-binding protein [Candidatus Methylacidiphilales bacterium]